MAGPVPVDAAEEAKETFVEKAKGRVGRILGAVPQAVGENAQRNIRDLVADRHTLALLDQLGERIAMDFLREQGAAGAENLSRQEVLTHLNTPAIREELLQYASHQNNWRAAYTSIFREARVSATESMKIAEVYASLQRIGAVTQDEVSTFFASFYTEFDAFLRYEGVRNVESARNFLLSSDSRPVLSPEELRIPGRHGAQAILPHDQMLLDKFMQNATARGIHGADAQILYQLAYTEPDLITRTKLFTTKIKEETSIFMAEIAKRSPAQQEALWRELGADVAEGARGTGRATRGTLRAGARKLVPAVVLLGLVGAVYYGGRPLYRSWTEKPDALEATRKEQLAMRKELLTAVKDEKVKAYLDKNPEVFFGIYADQEHRARLMLDSSYLETIVKRVMKNPELQTAYAQKGSEALTNEVQLEVARLSQDSKTYLLFNRDKDTKAFVEGVVSSLDPELKAIINSNQDPSSQKITVPSENVGFAYELYHDLVDPDRKDNFTAALALLTAKLKFLSGYSIKLKDYSDAKLLGAAVGKDAVELATEIDTGLTNIKEMVRLQTEDGTIRYFDSKAVHPFYAQPGIRYAAYRAIVDRELNEAQITDLNSRLERLFGNYNTGMAAKDFSDAYITGQEPKGKFAESLLKTINGWRSDNGLPKFASLTSASSTEVAQAAAPVEKLSSDGRKNLVGILDTIDKFNYDTANLDQIYAAAMKTTNAGKLKMDAKEGADLYAWRRAFNEIVSSTASTTKLLTAK